MLRGAGIYPADNAQGAVGGGVSRKSGAPALSWGAAGKKAIWGILLLVVAVVFVVPVFRLLLTSIATQDGLSLDAYRDVLTRTSTWKATYNTTVIGVASTFGALAAGTALAWLVAYTDVRFKAAIQFFSFLPYILPSYTIALAWRLLFSANGAVAAFLKLLPGTPAPPNLYSYSGIIFMHIITSFPPVFLLMTSALQRVPRDMEWAARTNGIGRNSVFFRINLPAIAPSFVTAWVVTFLSIIDNFGIPSILGVPAGISTLPTYIYEQIAGLGGTAFANGAVLSVLLIGLSMLALLLQKLLVKKADGLEAVRPDNAVRYRLGKGRLPVSLLVLGLLITISIIPVCSMAATALKSAIGLPLSLDNLTLKNFRFVLFENVKSRRGVVNSFAMAGLCTAVCLVLGTLLAHSLALGKNKSARAIEIMIQIPYSIPGIVLSLCMILFWMQPLPGVFPGIYGTSKILLIVYITRFLTVQSKASFSAIAGFDRSLEDAVRASGANPVTGWIWIVLPLLLPGILSGAVMVFVGILTELTLSSLLWSAGSETIGTTILSYQQSGYQNYSSAMSTVVCLLVIALYLVSQLYAWKKEKSDKSGGAVI